MSKVAKKIIKEMKKIDSEAFDSVEQISSKILLQIMENAPLEGFEKLNYYALINAYILDIIDNFKKTIED